MHKGIFITGTDTGVGKTFVAAGLLKAFKEAGFNACPMKPVETGCLIKKGKLIPEDTIKLINASGIMEPLDIINPYRFRHPLAPSVASEIEGIPIKKQKILSAYHYLSNKYNITIVEGAGGIMVPVYKKYLSLDLIADLRLPIIIVSRPELGTINHTCLTIDAAKRRRINILGVIINYSDRMKKGLAEKTNPKIIEKLSGVHILGTVPYSKTGTHYLKSVFHNILKELIR
ncbi:MAG: dethiobiotin synthase [Nitrospirae bacterium]|nr:dethiobiotin synthase [Nitrospirota bacterium]